MKKYGNLIFISAALLVLPLLLIYGQTLGQGVQEGFALAYRSVLPALFPMAVVCAVVGELAEVFPLPPAVTLWIQSQICGFPLGIKTVVRAYKRELLNREQAIALSRCCANASPAFLINYVGTQVLGSARAGLLIWCAQLAVSFSLAVKQDIFKGKQALLPPERPLAGLLAEGIASAAVGCLHLTGFIAFFTALSAFPGINTLHPLLEVTGGIGTLKSGQELLAGALIGLSGISVLLQNAGYLSAAELPIGPMLVSRIPYALGIPLALWGLERIHGYTAAIYLLFILFMISFDKRRKKRYNNGQRMILSRSVL